MKVSPNKTFARQECHNEEVDDINLIEEGKKGAKSNVAGCYCDAQH